MRNWGRGRRRRVALRHIWANLRGLCIAFFEYISDSKTFLSREDGSSRGPSRCAANPLLLFPWGEGSCEARDGFENSSRPGRDLPASSSPKPCKVRFSARLFFLFSNSCAINSFYYFRDCFWVGPKPASWSWRQYTRHIFDANRPGMLISIGGTQQLGHFALSSVEMIQIPDPELEKKDLRWSFLPKLKVGSQL